MRRGEEEEAAFQAEAGTYAKAAWWRVALLLWPGQEEERSTEPGWHLPPKSTGKPLESLL